MREYEKGAKYLLAERERKHLVELKQQQKKQEKQDIKRKQGEDVVQSRSQHNTDWRHSIEEQECENAEDEDFVRHPGTP